MSSIGSDDFSEQSQLIIEDAFQSKDYSLVNILATLLAKENHLDQALSLLASAAASPPESVLQSLLIKEELGAYEFMALQTLVYNLQDRDMNLAALLKSELRQAHDPSVRNMFANTSDNRN